MLKFTWNETDKETVLNLEGKAVINHIVELAETIRGRKIKLNSLRLNLSGLIACDLSFLQMLCASHQFFLKQNIRLHLEGTPTCFQELLQESGMGAYSYCEFEDNTSCRIGNCIQEPESNES